MAPTCCVSCRSMKVHFGSHCFDESGRKVGELWYCEICRAHFARNVTLAPPNHFPEKITDRREYPRFNVHFVIEVLLDGHGSPGPILATAVDASEGGVLFLSPKPITEGAEGRFRVSLPSVAESFEAIGKIVRCRPVPNQGDETNAVYGVGVRFIDVDARYRTALARYIRFTPALTHSGPLALS